MIIELFGPPGAGKTTFARALAAHLREHGHTVNLILSSRPAERWSSELDCPSDLQAQHLSFLIGRLARPFTELLAMARNPSTASQDIRIALNLIKVMRCSRSIWTLRLAQYLSRLSRAWSQASKTGDIVLFDQAFVQAICSLALLCGVADEPLISHALDEIPKSDFLVLLSAPAEIVELRLRDRQSQESRMERLLEIDPVTSLKSLAIIDRLCELLLEKGRQVTTVASLDQRSLHEAVERIEQQIVGQFDAERRSTTAPNYAWADTWRRSISRDAHPTAVEES